MTKTESAGGVVIGKDGKVLVTSQHGNSWSLPKGRIDEGEDALTAAKREITEETGVRELQLIRELPSYERYRIGEGGIGEYKGELKKIHMFFFRTEEELLKPTDSHNPEARWVEKEEVADLLTHPKDKEFFRSIISEL